MNVTHCPKQLKILLVGEGGQGIQSIAEILSKSAFDGGYHATYMPNFGTEQRGGISLSFIQISCDKIITPKFNKADIYVILSRRDISRTLRYIGKNTHVIYDKTIVDDATLKQIQKYSSNTFPVEAFKIATEKLTERSLNIIILGALVGIVDKELIKTVQQNMEEKFKKYYEKKPDLKETNENAFQIGLKLTMK